MILSAGVILGRLPRAAKRTDAIGGLATGRIGEERREEKIRVRGLLIGVLFPLVEPRHLAR